MSGQALWWSLFAGRALCGWGVFMVSRTSASASFPNAASVAASNSCASFASSMLSSGTAPKRDSVYDRGIATRHPQHPSDRQPMRYADRRERCSSQPERPVVQHDRPLIPGRQRLPVPVFIVLWDTPYCSDSATGTWPTERFFSYRRCERKLALCAPQHCIVGNPQRAKDGQGGQTPRPYIS